MPSRLAPAIVVYVNGQANSAWKPITAQRSSTAGRLDYIVLENNLAATGQRVAQMALVQGVSFEVEVVGVVSGQMFVYGWGKLSKQRVGVGNGEHVSYVARVEPFHFGIPVQGHVIYNAITGKHHKTDLPLVFNPIIDGSTEGNMREKNPLPGEVSVFIDPEAYRTDEAEKAQKSKGKLWTLAEAVYYLCKTLNPEKYILNPRKGDCVAMFNNAQDTIRNIVIPDGTYLSEALDLLIRPFGFSWNINYERRGRRSIQFSRRGDNSRQGFVGMQMPGEMLNTSKTNTSDFEVEYDLAEMYNQITGLGGFVEIEETYELKRAWSEEDDALSGDPDKLLRTDEDFNENRDVWRKWVLNEAGDYNGLREEIKKAHDFKDLKDEYTGDDFAPARRRRFLPMISLNLDKSPLGKIDGVSVQYWRTTGLEDDGEWVDVIDECQVLTRECGIYFTGKHPPEEIMREDDNAKVRVTAVIRFDTRLKYTAKKQGTSPNADIVEKTLDLSDRFQYRKIVQENVTVEDGKTLAVNDYEKLVYYCEQLRSAWDMASVSGPIQLEGIDNPQYQLGQTITGVVGRNVSFNAKGPNVGSAAFPQIVGITYDFQRQKTTLNLDQFRKDKLIERRSREDAAENKAVQTNSRTGERRR